MIRTRTISAARCVLCSTSLVMTVAVIAIGVRSFWVGDEVRWFWVESGGTAKRESVATIRTGRGGFALIYHQRRYPPYRIPKPPKTVCRGPLKWVSWTSPTYAHELPTSTLPRRLGFGYRNFSGPAAADGAVSNAYYVVPAWMISMLFALPSGLWFLYAVRRHKTGRCYHCGYDLRATPDRCPECGFAATVTARSTAPDFGERRRER